MALVSQGVVQSREEGHRVILAGLVRVNDVVMDKPGKMIPSDAVITLTAKPSPYVSRAGGKLAAALEQLDLNCAGLTTLDVGASTGGFTDCLLQRGVTRVYAVDVGYGQLAWRIRTDPRVVVLDRVNIRYLPRSAVPEPIDLAVIDVSFISLKIVLPCVMPFLTHEAKVITLLKPQFEVGVGQVGRGGIVRDESQRRQVTQDLLAYAQTLDLECIGILDSPVIGKKGNREILLGFCRSACPEVPRG
ncbi:MAG: TlyA family rRNA (cytidine-2'-O)-methyltransferase [Nitrospirales bacterium]|nr:TlyA family rRNA (cytidine-2'-O)-methyltransferase [Nitrospirales bacterium]